MLLKATHLPFVGVIWICEHLDVYRKRDSGPMSFSGPQTPTAAKRPLRLAINSPRLLRADTRAISSTAARAHSRSQSHSGAGQVEPDTQLKALVINLTAQVEALTAIVSRLQEDHEPSEAA